MTHNPMPPREHRTAERRRQRALPLLTAAALLGAGLTLLATPAAGADSRSPQATATRPSAPSKSAPVSRSAAPPASSGHSQSALRSAWNTPSAGHLPSHKPGHGHPGYGHPGYGRPGYGYWGGWYGGWSLYWGWPYRWPYYGLRSPYAYGYWGPETVVVAGNYGPAPQHGALDTDIRPGRAEVYVDGRRVGTADDFDGFPTYLWLPAGTYDVAFYSPGFVTIARQYTIYAGQVIDVGDRMEPGEAVRPEDLVSKSTVNRDERVRRNQEREEAVRQMTAPPAGTARLVLDVAPGDAAVYLDGRFLGTAEELAGLHSGLIIELGDHELAVVRPGFGEKHRRFTAAEDEEIILRVDLGDQPARE